MKMLKNIDLRKVRVFYFVCTFMAMLPPHRFGRKARKPSLQFKLYTAFHILFLLALYVYSSYGRELYVYTEINGVVSIINRICSLSLTLLNVFMRIRMIYVNGLYFQRFINSIDKLSQRAPFKRTPNRLLQLQFLIFSVYLLLLIAFDVWTWISAIGLKLYWFFAMEDLLFYNINVIISFSIYTVIQIKHFFLSLNNLLNVTCKTLICLNDQARVTYVLDELNIKSLPSKDMDSSHRQLSQIRKYYNIICDFIEQFNEIYGLIILFAVITIIFFITNQVDILIAYAFHGYAKELMQNSKATTLMAVMNVLWVITLFILSTLLAYACNTAISEREKLIQVCIYWFNQMPSTSLASPKEKEYKEELQLLLQQMTVRKPIFSAAGFFPLDFTLLGFIIGSVTSFMIVSIQFI